MYLSIITLPLLGALTSGLLGRKLGVKGSQFITSTCLLITTALALVSFYEVALLGSAVTIKLTEWIDSEFMLVSWGFNFDSLTVSMLLPVLIVSSLVHLYSISYMNGDPHNQRFFSYLSMFTFFMLLLITGDNYLILFIGWEGVGISSYLLINFWFTRLQANKSAIKALTINRVGDMFLTLGLFGSFWAFGNLDFSTLFSLSPYINDTVITITGICFLLAAMGKSAQIGLHTWLPDAMEGPTPVSALIHAATMVTAGVYLLLRSSPLLEYSSTSLILITWIGALTAFFAATTGLLQNDLKRVIAYSTCSQLGYMVMACGLSQYNIALFHLVNHAFFKALLFMAAGSVIHAMADQQDMRKLGGLINILPFTYTMILIGSLSLMAFPFLTGFYSKDLIIESAYSGSYVLSGRLGYWLTTLSALFTAVYSARLIYLTFLSRPNGNKLHYMHSHEGDFFMVLPLTILAIMSIFFGYLNKDLFVGMGTDFLANSLFIHPNHISLIDSEFAIPLLFKLLPAIFSISGSIIILVIYNNFSRLLIKLTDNTIDRKMYYFFNQKYYFDIIINSFIIRKGLNLANITSKVLDRGIVELVGPYGIVNKMVSYSNSVSKLDTGIITNYALYIVLGLISIIYVLFLSGDPRLLLIYVTAIISLSGLNKR